IRWYTTIWTIIFFVIIYVFAGIFACIVFHKYRWSFLIPVGFLFVALITGFVGGTIIGYVLAALYSSGDFPMSVWIPFLWGLIQAFL
ncbi:21974_t:CDS:2, partial [Racocetra persica]